MAVMLYALYTYHWRANAIRTGGRGPYDDRFGPVSMRSSMLCSTLTELSRRQYYALLCSVCLHTYILCLKYA